MGAKVQSADYSKMAQKAAEMENMAIDINTNLTSVVTKVGELKNTWKGKQYDKLVETVNNYQQTFNNTINLFIRDIPENLMTAAKNYAAVNEDRVNDTLRHKVVEIDKLADSGKGTNFAFDESIANAAKGEIETKLNICKNKLTDYRNAYNSIGWNSDAATYFSNAIKKYTSECETAFNKIKETLAGVIADAAAMNAKAEQNNTLK